MLRFISDFFTPLATVGEIMYLLSGPASILLQATRGKTEIDLYTYTE